MPEQKDHLYDINLLLSFLELQQGEIETARNEMNRHFNTLESRRDGMEKIAGNIKFFLQKDLIKE